MKLYHASIEDRENELDVNCNIFKNRDRLIDFIDEKYCGKNKKVIFVAMPGYNTTDYFITDSYLKVQEYFMTFFNTEYFLFEEPTYEEALRYCIGLCEIHPLGLNP